MFNCVGWLWAVASSWACRVWDWVGDLWDFILRILRLLKLEAAAKAILVPLWGIFWSWTEAIIGYYDALQLEKIPALVIWGSAILGVLLIVGFIWWRKGTQGVVASLRAFRDYMGTFAEQDPRAAGLRGKQHRL